MTLLAIIVVAVVCLVFGATTGPQWLLWVALAAAVVGLVVLVANVWQRRRATTGATPSAEAAASTGSKDNEAGESAPEVRAPSPAEGAPAGETPPDSIEDAPSSVQAPSAAEPLKVEQASTPRSRSSEHATATESSVAEDDRLPEQPVGVAAASTATDQLLVLVVAGRHRFHASACPLLEGRTTQRVSLGEAMEEGFSPCTTCDPAGQPT